ncbi:DUF5676 family membrane protein [Pseudomonas boanensis]|uniref:DUF5676 family membrane protein n=1 Tax=Metapseudomonas boanensis TaxID=2822138 RepID=UPI0035D40587
MIAPWKTGLALALTMAISYTVCALLYALWPAQGIAFLNALFHGLDFGRLERPQAYTVATFVGPLLVLILWGLMVGTLFAWLYDKFHGKSR